MSDAKSALIIANYQYEHPELRQLLAPAADAESLARVLSDPAIGGFEVRTVINQPSHKVNLEIETFLDDRQHDDLLLLYFSGHGIKDVDGLLYFATIDTQLMQHNVRRSTAVSASFVNEVMSRSRSRRQVLLLDCCYSGAFKKGMLAKGGRRVGAGDEFEGQGRIVLTASDALQYSFEGGQVAGQGVRSVFTQVLVRGLESGEADLDRDGCFSLDEVYDYVYAQVSYLRPEQKPTKMGFVEGRIFLGNNPRPLMAELPTELRDSLEDARPWVRVGAVQQLEKLLAGKSKGLGIAARTALESLVRDDDSLQVRRAASSCLATGTDALTLKQPQTAMLTTEPAVRGLERITARQLDPSEAGRVVLNQDLDSPGSPPQKPHPEHQRDHAPALMVGTHWRRVKSVIASVLTNARTYLVLVARHARGASVQLFALAARRRIEFYCSGAVVVIVVVVLLSLFLVARSHFRRGVELDGKKETDGAISEYRASIRLNPYYAEAHKNLASLLFQKGDRKGGISELRKVAWLRLWDNQAHYDLASQLQFEKDGVEEAISQFREAIRLKPDQPGAHVALGGVLGNKGDLDGAIAEYREAIRLKPEEPYTHLLLGEGLTKKGDLDGAISQYRESFHLYPPYGWEHLGPALEKEGYLDEAISVYRKALDAHPLSLYSGSWLELDSPLASNDLASALERKGDLQGARDQYAASCGTDSSPTLLGPDLIDAACQDYARLSNALGLPVEDIKVARWRPRKKSVFDLWSTKH